MTKFLAEDFRKILNVLDGIAEAEVDKQPEERDIDDLLVTDRPEGVSKESIKTIYDLIDYLDQFPELKQYRNDDAAYDDAYYDNVPLDDFIAVSNLTLDDLKRIDDNLDAYEGSVVIMDNTVSVFGGD